MRGISVVAVAALSALSALSALPCAASPLTASELQARIKSEAAGCPAAAPRLKIERLTIAGASQHNKVRRDMGAKANGQPGQRYAIVYVRSGRQVVPVRSLGPLDAAVKPDDLHSLHGVDHCSVDEG